MMLLNFGVSLLTDAGNKPSFTTNLSTGVSFFSMIVLIYNGYRVIYMMLSRDHIV